MNYEEELEEEKDKDKDEEEGGAINPKKPLIDDGDDDFDDDEDSDDEMYGFHDVDGDTEEQF